MLSSAACRLGAAKVDVLRPLHPARLARIAPARRQDPHAQPLASRRGALPIRAAAKTDKSSGTGGSHLTSVAVDNSSDAAYTLITLQGANRPGLLASLTSTFTDLGLDVMKAEIGSSKGGDICDKFWVNTLEGSKVPEHDVPATIAALELSLASYGKGNVRPKLKVPGAPEARSELLHTLMGKAFVV